MYFSYGDLVALTARNSSILVEGNNECARHYFVAENHFSKVLVADDYMHGIVCERFIFARNSDIAFMIIATDLALPNIGSNYIITRWENDGRETIAAFQERAFKRFTLQLLENNRY